VASLDASMSIGIGEFYFTSAHVLQSNHGMQRVFDNIDKQIHALCQAQQLAA
jgi:hypothetical protein